MYFDRSYTLKGAGADVMFIPPEGDTLKYAIQFEFLATNNFAEKQRAWHSVTPHPRRFSAGSETSAERV
jgi:hypothetical protein